MCDSSSYLKACDNFFKYIFKEEIIDINEEILFSLLENSLKKNNFIYKKQINMDYEKGCRAIIKSGIKSGTLCGKKCMANLDYCRVHKSKLSPKTTLKFISDDEEDEVPDSKVIIRKNKFNNFVYGDTGLIIKSATEKYVVAKEGAYGEWTPLSTKDIELCNKLQLRHKLIDLNFQGETTNKEVLNSFKFLSNKKEKEPMLMASLKYDDLKYDELGNEEFNN